MAYNSYPNAAWNSRAISLAEHEQLAYPLGGSGLLDFDGVAPVYGDSSGRQVKLRSGVRAIIRGTRFNNTSETLIDNTKIVANSSGSPRIDLVVLRLDRTATAPNAYTIRPDVITGTPATTPIAPSPRRDDATLGTSYYDIPLAEVAVANGASTITAANVTNRAWWVTSSGYTGFDAAKPPAEPGIVFRGNDAGITWVGTAGGSWQPLYFNGGWVQPASASGWNPATFHFNKVNDLVIMNARLFRTGAAVAATTDIVMTTLGTAYRPTMAMWGVYHCSSPDHSSFVLVDTDGTVKFFATGTGGAGIDTGAAIISNMVWPTA